MKYYYICEIRDYDEFVIGTSDDIFEAMKMARDAWDSLSPIEREHRDIQIRHYLHDIEDEDCECFDFDVVPEAWYWWFAVCRDDEDCDHGYGSFDWYEAYSMAADMYANNPDTQIVTVDYRDDYCVDVERFEDIKRNMEMDY